MSGPLDRVTRSATWRVFAGVAALALLLDTVRQLWQGSDTWNLTEALDKLWGGVLPIVATFRAWWEDDDRRPWLLLGGIGISLGFVLRSLMASAERSRKDAQRGSMMRAGGRP